MCKAIHPKNRALNPQCLRLFIPTNDSVLIMANTVISNFSNNSKKFFEDFNKILYLFQFHPKIKFHSENSTNKGRKNQFRSKIVPKKSPLTKTEKQINSTKLGAHII